LTRQHLPPLSTRIEFLIVKLGRFRITLKKDMCGNCSTYCEMGIDVRQYAMANQSFTRASCVACGLCQHDL
jgi:Pyruvate/2-oxoacid:ferredoxin oxidoreductase delta subunit